MESTTQARVDLDRGRLDLDRRFRLPAVARRNAESRLVHLQLRIERVAQPVAQEVEADERHGEDDRPEQQLVREGTHVPYAFGDEDAPARERRPHAEPEEGESGFGRDRAGYA